MAYTSPADKICMDDSLDTTGKLLLSLKKSKPIAKNPIKPNCIAQLGQLNFTLFDC